MVVRRPSWEAPTTSASSSPRRLRKPTRNATSTGRNTTGTTMARWNRCSCSMPDTDRQREDLRERYGPTPGLWMRLCRTTTATADSPSTECLSTSMHAAMSYTSIRAQCRWDSECSAMSSHTAWDCPTCMTPTMGQHRPWAIGICWLAEAITDRRASDGVRQDGPVMSAPMPVGSN